jgi:hypothetical protein
MALSHFLNVDFSMLNFQCCMTFVISSMHIPRNEIQAAIHTAASYADVEYVLRQTTSYCQCGSDDTVRLLWEMLEILDERKHTDTNVEYRIVTEKIEALLGQCGRAGYGCWFVYGMEHSGWLTHGSNIFDLWITSEGESLLKALRRFPPSHPHTSNASENAQEVAISLPK